MKNIVFSAILGLTVLMAGCQPTGTEGPSATGPRDGKRFKIGVSIPAADHGWTAGIKYWAEEAAKLHPDIDWIIEDAKSPDEQITDLENLQSQGVDALVILATESAPITPIAKRLKDAGILIVNVDRGFTEPVADIFIEGDNKAFGRKAAQFIVQKLNGQGNIAILEGIPSTVNTDRVQAALEVFRAAPGIRIVAQDSGQWNRERAESVMQNMLSANPQIDAIWAADDDMALGVETALRAAGRDKNVWIVGGGGMKDVVKRVMDGDPLYPATVTYSPSMIAVGMQMAAGTLKAGRENVLKFMPKHMMIDVELITPENASSHYFPDSVY
ncbi:MAG: ABC transporter substrate-binding protein [Fimbriimonadales bacterium]|nr:ABC transporter substrate-binding protein [Fimbriimonadales bacterium]